MKKKVATAKMEAMHFKMRVMDLLDVFIRRRSASALVLQLIVPLLRILGSADSSKSLALKTRVAGALNKYQHCCNV